MIPGQTKQFDTFDNLEDRRELVILFQKLGEGLPDAMANEVRAKFIEDLIPASVSGLADAPLKADPRQCHPSGAYMLFVQVVGVLGVPIRDAARKLDGVVKRREWMNYKVPQTGVIINASEYRCGFEGPKIV